MDEKTIIVKKNIRLMNRNTEVARFNGKLINKIFAKNSFVPYLQADSIHVLDTDKCPIFLSDKSVAPEKQVEWFNSWLKRRCISDKRRDIPTGLRYAKDDTAFPHMFSLYDQYWLKFNETEKWEHYNFFDNDYSTLFGDFCFSLNKDAFLKSEKNIFYEAETPDITTGGITPKAWKRINGENFLFKYELSDKSQTPLNEIMASHFLSKLNFIDFVNYEYGIYEYQLCSKCTCFVDRMHEFIPMSDLYNLYVYHNSKNNLTNQENEKYANNNDNIYKTLSEIIKKYDIRNGITFINKMIIVDIMLMNYDRHLGNFGVLRNVETGKIEKFAPLFDFGSAFFLNENEDRKRKKLFTQERVQQAFTGYFKEKISKGIYEDLVSEINKGYYFNLNEDKKDKLKKDLLIQGDKIRTLIKNGGQERKKAQKHEKDKKEPIFSLGFFENV